VTGAKIVLAGIAGFLGLVLLVVILHVTGVYVFGGVQRSTADYRGETDVIEKTRADGDYRIAAYETFYDQCAAIQAKQATVQQLEDQLENAETNDDREWINRTLTGIRASLNSDITKYNADARKEDTQGHFRASDLPYQIDLNDKEVSCS
jgi:hypothetical protein